MDFDPKSLPDPAREAFEYGAIAWPLVVQEMIKAGVTDANELADIVFFLHHPERNGQKIEPGEDAMIEQWVAFRTLVKPLLRGKKGSKKSKRYVPIDLFALQYGLTKGGGLNFPKSFSTTWSDGEFWVAILHVGHLVKLVKDRCRDNGYVRVLRLGGHGNEESFRLGNIKVEASNISYIATQLKPILPYFKPGHSLIQLDHCKVGNNKALLKRISKAFGGVAVVAALDTQVYNDGPPAFEGSGAICGPSSCADVVDLNLPLRDMLELLDQ